MKLEFNVCLFFLFLALPNAQPLLPQEPPQIVRIATFNCSLNRPTSKQLCESLATLDDQQAQKIAKIIQIVRPDIILLNEFDYDEDSQASDAFQAYLETSWDGTEPIHFPYRFARPVNTGVDSNLDLNSDGKLGTPDDSFGFGLHPGQYGMLVLSKYPIDQQQSRTFQKYLWKNMPNPNWPRAVRDNRNYYPPTVEEVFRLSSKSHWDVCIRIHQNNLRFLVSHPTPPVFDGAEDRNGCRNFDEIRFWAEYISNVNVMEDDQAVSGGLSKGAKFVIAGDMNADPLDGESRHQAIRQLLEHPEIQDPKPTSRGGVVQAKRQAGANLLHQGDPALDTSDFDDRKVGNLRTDYVLPAKSIQVKRAGVFWPAEGEAHAELVAASDHRLVWVEIEWPK